jgi:hypothetical protein
MIRRIAASLTALVLLLGIAAPVLAGGWAEIVADAQTTEPPIEGTPIVVGFTVLQHGQTPAPWEAATVHFTDSATGKQIDVVATNDRPDGHFIATATLPEAGYWSWHVTLRDLISEHPPVAITVLTASGAQPPFDPTTTLAAIDRAKREMTDVMNTRLLPEIERLDGILSAERARTERLTTELQAIGAERDALAERVAAVEGSGGLPVIGLVTIAVLAGATAGFAMSWLAGRPRPSVTLSPAPRGADPV